MKDAARIAIGIMVGIVLSLPVQGSEFKEGELIVKFKTSGYAAHSMVAAEESRALTVAVDDTSVALDEMQNRDDVEYAEPNYIIEAESIPEDWPYAEAQWSQIDLPEAWTLLEETGPGAKVMIAVIDSGVDRNHPDLDGILGSGYDFADNDALPDDDTGHGTRVAGIIGALGNNGFGVAGIAWNIDVEIMPLKFMKEDENGKTTGTVSDAVSAIYHAVDHGADIINASWGFYSYSRALEEAIQYAMSRGVLFIASAGNKGQNNDIKAHYPSNYNLDNIIAVAAMNSSGEIASFSNYGVASVDIAAPGVGLSSTDLDGGYISWASGTSYAAPFVTAIAAMVKSQSPEIGYQALRGILIGSVIEEEGFPLSSVAGGGCINAYHALLAEEEFDVSSSQGGTADGSGAQNDKQVVSGEGGGGGGCMMDSSRNPGSALILSCLMILAVLFRMPNVGRPE